MITVNCSQCKALLEMDDAFAGGVCRCHYCGTIQSVPANAKRVGIAPASPVVAPRGNGSPVGASAAPGAGLDVLADVVAGAQNRAGLQAVRQPVAPAARPVDYARPQQQKNMMLPLVIAIAVIALLLVVLGYLVVGRSSTTVITPVPGRPGPGDGGGNVPGPIEPDAPVVVPKGPHFCGISLDRVPSVVYVLDRGQATAELFDTLKETTYRSLESLKAGQKFQIIFWDNADAPAAYPNDGLVNVSPAEIEAARAQFVDVLAGGRARADAAVERAAKSQPSVIIIVTGKAFDLDNALTEAVAAATQGTKTKVHTIALRSDDDNKVLKDIAEKTHGEFHVISAKELREYSY